MKKNWLFITISLLAMLFASCDSAEETGVTTPLHNWNLFASWVNISRDDSVFQYLRIDSLNCDNEGFAIFPNGTFIHRSNAGWCATPPITYANYDGTWKAVTDSLLEINVGYWGGTTSYRMLLRSLKRDTLVVVIR